MDKEKQIEEMKREIIKTFSTEYIYAQSEVMKNISDINVLIRSLISKGYRKITENEVVISKEEYEKLKQEQTISYTAMINGSYLDRIGDLENRLLNIRKETARKIADELLEHYFALSHLGNCLLEFTKLQEIVKKYGVDLGEEV